MYKKKNPITLPPAANPSGGFSYDEINRLWSCSRASADPSEVNKKIYPKEKNYDKTKWKSIITVGK